MASNLENCERAELRAASVVVLVECFEHTEFSLGKEVVDRQTGRLLVRSGYSQYESQVRLYYGEIYLGTPFFVFS